MNLATARAQAAGIALAVCAPLAHPAAGADDAALRLAEVEAALAAALDRVGLLEADAAAAEEKLEVLAGSLAAANAESQTFQDQYRQLRLRVEALGVEALDENGRGLDRRLLNALNDLRLARAENEALMDRLLRLSEAAIEFKATAAGADPAAALRLDEGVARANEALGIAQNDSPLARELSTGGSATVLSLKPDLGLVVVGNGEREGVRIGTPLRLYRDDRAVATAIVVDVREKISGALLTGTVGQGETVKVGDIARLDVQKPSSN